MKNKFTILGCGSSLGVPWINGNYGKCNPKNNKIYVVDVVHIFNLMI